MVASRTAGSDTRRAAASLSPSFAIALIVVAALCLFSANSAEARTVAGFCSEGEFVSVPVSHETDATAIIVDAELRADASGTTNLVGPRLCK